MLAFFPKPFFFFALSGVFSLTSSHFYTCKVNTSCITSYAARIVCKNKSLGISSTCVWCVRHFMECCKSPVKALDLCTLAVSKHISSVSLSAHRGLVPLTSPHEWTKLASMHVLHQVMSLLKVTPRKNKLVDITVLGVLFSKDQIHLGCRIGRKN